MTNKLFLDMDGVLADFVQGISQAHGRPDPYTDERTRGKSLGLFDIELIWGITPKEFWAPSNTVKFWQDLPKTPECDTIVSLAKAAVGEENVAILTAPSLSEGCIPGKQDWIARYFPEFSKRIIVASAKEFLAGPHRFLIDDRDKNIDAFESAGGRGILVPRLWNREWPNASRTMYLVQKEILETINNQAVHPRSA